MRSWCRPTGSSACSRARTRYRTPVFTQAVGLLLEATSTRSPKRSTPDSNEGGRKGPRH